MKSIAWTRRTPLTQANLQQMLVNDYENYAIVAGSAEPPIAFVSSTSGDVYNGSNRAGANATGSMVWHSVKDLTIRRLQMNTPGVYRVSAHLYKVSQTTTNLVGQIFPTFPDQTGAGNAGFVAEDGSLAPDQRYYTDGEGNSQELPGADWATDGWEVGLRMDGRIILGSVIYAQSGHQYPAIPQGFIHTYQPSVHTFEVCIRPYVAGYVSPQNAGEEDGYIRAHPDANVQWGDTNSIAQGDTFPGYHMVQYIGAYA